MMHADLEEEDINTLEDDWVETIEMTTLEKIFTVDKKSFDNIMEDLYETNIERFPEESDSIEAKIKKAFNESIDIDKFNNLLPSLYYPNGIKEVITKQDLLEYIN